MGALLTASAFGSSGRTLEPIHFLHLPHQTEKQFPIAIRLKMKNVKFLNF
jgi:hypothetical protein